MRLVFLAIAASMTLAGCGKDEATGDTSAIDQAVTANDFETNDVTAIDAATGAAANMAADVDINAIGNEDTESPRPAASSSSRPPRNEPRSNDSAPAAAPAPADDEPAAETNSAD